MTTHVVVTGGRGYSDADVVATILGLLNPDVIHHGAATGADSLCANWANLNNKVAIPYPYPSG